MLVLPKPKYITRNQKENICAVPCARAEDIKLFSRQQEIVGMRIHWYEKGKSKTRKLTPLVKLPNSVASYSKHHTIINQFDFKLIKLLEDLFIDCDFGNGLCIK